MRKALVSAFVGLSLATVLALPALLPAQEQSAARASQMHLRYKLVDLGTLGGPETFLFGGDIISHVQVLTGAGEIAAWSATSLPDPYPDFCWDGDCFLAHSISWRGGKTTDLGALPRGASSDTRWISQNGLIAGDSENGQFDPLIPGAPEIRAVLWDHGRIINLGTLHGGYESIAHAVNNSGQVVGLSLSPVLEDDSIAAGIYGLGFQTRAFLWQNGVMHDLGALGSGTDAMALLVNETGQVAGNSYTSSDTSPTCAQFSQAGFALTTGGFLWERGKMTDLGGFGGTCTVVSDLNNRGQVVGQSNLAGDQVFHPFLWTAGKLKDLGTLGGDTGRATALNDAGDVAGWADLSGNLVNHAFLWSAGRMSDLGGLAGFPCTVPFDINSAQQVVGISHDCSFGEASAFLWQRGGPMIDLNAFVPPGSDLHLRNAVNINDSGVIAVYAELPTGELRTVVLLPCTDEPWIDPGCREAGPIGPGNHGPTLKVQAATRARFAQRYRSPFRR